MKVKRIITTGGIILGGLITTQAASAAITYQGSSDVQFTFAPSLALALTGGDFIITELFPGNSDISNEVTATVSTNSVAGYELSATVGNDTNYNSTALVTAGGDTIAMMGSGTSLTSGTWGYTLNNGSTYGALSRSTDTILNKTTDISGTPATGYTGTNSTSMKIGAYAAVDQTPGVYHNVVNFKVVSNVATHTVTLAKGNNVSSVTLDGSGTSGDYTSGTAVSIAATCKTGHNFVNWALSNDYGTIANANLASTTFNVGPGNVTITAYCDGEDEGESI